MGDFGAYRLDRRPVGSVGVVVNVTSFGRSGLSDFVVQRLTAVVLGLYGLCVVGFLLANPDLTQKDLADYFGSTSMAIFSTLALLSLLAHAWVGMWTVGTDYVRPWSFGSSATVLRFIYQGGVSLILVLYTLWGLSIVWGL